MSADAPGTRPITGVVLDIEGTTTPVSFVYDVLFPYARQQLRGLLRDRAEDDVVRDAIDRLRAEWRDDHARDQTVPAWGDDSDSIARYLEWLMDSDRKSPALKTIQGLIWEKGYAEGFLRGELYDDVPRAIERWRSEGTVVAIYSSGSVLAQQLLFGHSTAGDVTPLIAHYFDTSVGPKRAPESYERIASAMQLHASEILFISDIEAELAAAQASGFNVILCDRKRTGSASSRFPVIESFDELATAQPATTQSAALRTPS